MRMNGPGDDGRLNEGRAKWVAGWVPLPAALALTGPGG